MDYLMVAAALGFGPTLLLMYLVLKRYTYPAVESPFFSDPTLFGLLVVGFIAGIAIFWGYTQFVLNWGSIFIAAGFALVMELAKFVILNLKRFHGKSDTIFYGYAVGLGLGCMMAIGTVYYFLRGAGDPNTGDWVVSTFMGLTYILLQSSAGTTIGEGVARKRPWEFFFQSLFVTLVVMFLIMLVYSADELQIYLSLAAALIVSAVFFYRVHYIKLPAIVKEILRNESRRPKEERSD